MFKNSDFFLRKKEKILKKVKTKKPKNKNKKKSEVTAKPQQEDYRFGDIPMGDLKREKTHSVGTVTDTQIEELKTGEVTSSFVHPANAIIDERGKIFEPKKLSKGNIARAIFYIAAIYGDFLFFGETLSKSHRKRQRMARHKSSSARSHPLSTLSRPLSSFPTLHTPYRTLAPYPPRPKMRPYIFVPSTLRKNAKALERINT